MGWWQQVIWTKCNVLVYHTRQSITCNKDSMSSTSTLNWTNKIEFSETSHENLFTWKFILDAAKHCIRASHGFSSPV